MSASCRIADILFGKIRLDIISRSDYETAIIRSIEMTGGPRSSVRDPQRAYGRILGEITVGRGAFSVAGIDQVIVGQISPQLVIEGGDNVCGDSRVVIRPVQEGGYVNGGPFVHSCYCGKWGGSLDQAVNGEQRLPPRRGLWLSNAAEEVV